jgi:hypothetical protein
MRAMDAATPRADIASDRDSTRALLVRLWHEHIRHHRARLVLVLVLTGLMAGTTALYPVVIDHAFEMFTNRDRRILYQLPALVVAITSIKAAAQYFQNVQVQQVVLLMSANCKTACSPILRTPTWRGWSARRRRSSPPASPPMPPSSAIR